MSKLSYAVIQCQHQKKRDKAAVQCMSEKNVEISYNSLGKASKKQFCFDGVFDEKTTQKEFYDNVVCNVVDEMLQVFTWHSSITSIALHDCPFVLQNLFA